VCFLNLKTWWFLLEQDVPIVNFIGKLNLKHKIADNILQLICIFKCNSPILFLCCCKTVLAYGKMLSWLLNNHWAYKTFSSWPYNDNILNCLLELFWNFWTRTMLISHLKFLQYLDKVLKATSLTTN